MLHKSVVLLDPRLIRDDIVYRMRYRSTQRCLFGPIDPKEAKDLASEEQLTIWEEFTKRWNFDPEKQQVLPGGQYEWFRDGPDSGPEESGQDHVTGPVRTNRRERDSALPYVVQSKLTDLMRIRKPAGLRPSAGPTSSSSVEERSNAARQSS